MLSEKTPWNLVAQGYADVVMQIFRYYSDSALQRTRINGQSRILDVACGPGTLSIAAAAKVGSVDAVDFAPAMIEILQDNLDREKIPNVNCHCGDAQALPYENEVFDMAFSMFGLMFFPDRDKGYAEILRCLKPGGEVVVSSWAPVADSPAMQAVFGALRAMNPDMPSPSTDLESLENPDFFRMEMERAGFINVDIQRVTQHMQYVSPESFWDDMIKGSAPLVMMKRNMSEKQWQEKNLIALDYLHKQFGSEARTLSSDAWLAYGVKPV